MRRRIREEIRNLFRTKGGDAYTLGEPITQLQHALQAAECARRDRPEDTEMMTAALLHDIGHLVESPHTMDTYGNLNHEMLGSRWLRERGFGERIASIVEGHVDAKRYLVSKNDAYANRLSEASVQTLRFQGGPMCEKECVSFEKSPFFEDILRMREYDERAKGVTIDNESELLHFHLSFL